MLFLARKHRNLRVVLDPHGMVIDGGQRMLKGLKGDFATGMDVEFVDGTYETNDPKIIKAMKSHPRFGITFYSDDAEADTPSQDEASKVEETQKYTEQLASKCEFCGKEFANTGLLAAHHKKCKKNPNL